MKIGRLKPDPDLYYAIRQALEHLLVQPTDAQARPCPNCSIACPSCGSPSCTCICSSTCEYAPRQMSSEPDTLPIEPGIVPLVYALYTLKVCPPCWSCEGHNNATGELHKLPRVWFYAQALAYPNLLAEYVSQLRIDGVLTYPWCIRVVHWGNPLETSFSIEPCPKPGDNFELDGLRKDVRNIAGKLLSGVGRLARSRIVDLNSALNKAG